MNFSFSLHKNTMPVFSLYTFLAYEKLSDALARKSSSFTSSFRSTKRYLSGLSLTLPFAYVLSTWFETKNALCNKHLR